MGGQAGGGEADQRPAGTAGKPVQSLCLFRQREMKELPTGRRFSWHRSNRMHFSKALSGKSLGIVEATGMGAILPSDRGEDRSAETGRKIHLHCKIKRRRIGSRVFLHHGPKFPISLNCQRVFMALLKTLIFCLIVLGSSQSMWCTSLHPGDRQMVRVEAVCFVRLAGDVRSGLSRWL